MQTEGGLITAEALEVYKSRVGMSLHVSSIFNRQATNEAVTRFCDGIGEGNPLFREPDYAATTPWGGIIAPPSFVMSVFPGWVLQGLPGVHAFHTSSDFTFNLPIRQGAQIIPESKFTGYRCLQSKLGENTICEYQTATYRDEKGRILTQAKVTGVRTERSAARDANLYKDIVLPHPWTDEELLALEERVLSEKCRGQEPLFFEDVAVGDVLPTLIKGPLGLTDIIAYCIGASPVKLKAHGLALEEFRRHPAWGFRDCDSRTLEPIFGVHYSQSAAKAAGMPYPYDIGSQRHTWLIQMLTNWVGDTGWLQRCFAKYTGFVFLSDAVTLNGEVSRVYQGQAEFGYVDVKTTAVNQRGQEVMKGTSTVLLPSRSGTDSASIIHILKEQASLPSEENL